MRPLLPIALCFLLASCQETVRTDERTRAKLPADTVYNPGNPERHNSSATAPAGAADKDFAALDALLAKLRIPAQGFTIGGDSTSTITGAKGTKITVVPADLETAEGSRPSGPITVSLIELQSKGDLLRHGVTTTSDGRLLESGGSYHIAMSAGGKALRLKRDRTLTIQVPRLSDRDMELFYGEEGAAGGVNWKSTGTAFASPASIAARNGGPRSAKSAGSPGPGDSAVVRFEIPKFRDTILGTMEMRPGHPQKKIAPEVSRRYGPVVVRLIDGSFCYVGKVADTANRRYAERRVAGLESFSRAYYETTRLSRLGWLNVDKFLEEPTYTLSGKLPAGSGFRGIQTYLLYRDFNGVAGNRVQPDADNRVSIPGLAKNRPMRLIALTWHDGKPYAYAKAFEGTETREVLLDLKKVSDDGLRAIMSM